MLALLWSLALACDMSCPGANFSYTNADGVCACTDVRLEVTKYTYATAPPNADGDLNLPQNYLINPCTNQNFGVIFNGSIAVNFANPTITIFDVDFVGTSSNLQDFLCLNSDSTPTLETFVTPEANRLTQTGYSFRFGGPSDTWNRLFANYDQWSSGTNYELDTIKYSIGSTNDIYNPYYMKTSYGSQTFSLFQTQTYLIQSANLTMRFPANPLNVCMQGSSSFKEFYTIAVKQSSTLPSCSTTLSLKPLFYSPVVGAGPPGTGGPGGPGGPDFVVHTHDHLHNPVHSHYAHSHAGGNEPHEHPPGEHEHPTNRGTPASTWAALGLGTAALLAV